MKKILSTILALAMLLSMVGTMSMTASAMGENENYPLLYETYESEKALDAMVRSGSGKGTVTVASEGVNGSGGALAVSQTSAGNYIDITYPTTVKIEKGQKLELSWWMKLKSDLKTDVSDANRISLIFYGSGTVTGVGSRTDIQVGDAFTGNGWKQFDISGKLVKDQWVKFEYNVTWESAMSIGNGATIGDVTVKSVALRVANLNGTNAVVDGKNLEYELDDFVIRYPAPGTDAAKLSFRDDFDGNATTGDLDGRSEDCSPNYRTVVYANTGVNEELGYIKDKQANYSINSVKPEMGRMYKFSGWFRFDADDTATDFVAEQAELRLIFMGKDRNDPAFMKGTNYPSFYSKPFAEGEWTYLEYYFYMDYRAYTKNPGGYLYTRLCPIASYKGGELKHHRDHTIPGTYSFDNIKVEEVDAGSMELDGSVPVIRNFTETEMVVPGWNGAGSEVEAVSEEGNTYVRVTATSNKYGSVQTPYAFENGKKYKISFRAKAENLEDGVTQPLSLILDRKVSETGTEDAYAVPNYQYVIGGDQVSSSSSPVENHPWQISNEWQTFTTTYATNFQVKEGMEAVAPGVNPRCASTYLYTYDAEGNVSPYGTVICIDDFAVEELPVPTVENILFSREGSTIRVNYTYVPAGSEAENKDATLIRAFMKNGETETNIGTFSGNEAFTVPAIAFAKEVFYEIIPVDENGNIGNAKTALCSEIFDFNIETELKADITETVAEYKMVANSAKGADLCCTMLLASYNGNKLIDVYSEDITIEDGYNSVYGTFEFPGNANKVKMMIVDKASFAPVVDVKEIKLSDANADPFAGDDEINIVFLGDSIYAGSGASSVDNRWVTKVGKWFEETYEDENTAVNWYNQGKGGTTSHYSFVRIERDVLKYNPDIVFVTMTPNDGNTDTTREMESVIRTLQELPNPPYIMMTYFTNRSWRVSPGYGDAVAEHYGIPVYNNTVDLKNDMEATGREIEAYFADGTHPNDAGYAVIADGIIDWISSGRHFAKPDNAEKLADNAVTMVSSQFISAEDDSVVTREGSWVAGSNYLQTNQEGDMLSFTFDGNFIAFEHGLHKNSGKYEVYVDGELKFTGNPYYNNIETYMMVCKGDSTYLDLEDGEHIVEIKTVASQNAETTAENYGVRLYDIIVGTVAR